VLELSAPGRRALEQVLTLRAGFAARVVAPLSKQDLDDFERMAQKLIEAFASEDQKKC
jgi:hypothetical protein